MASQEVVLKETGYFWWRDSPTIEGPTNGSVAGELTIHYDGRVHLDLHGTLPGQDAVMDGVFAQGKPLPEGTAIMGILKGGTRRILLWNLYSSGAHAAFAAGAFSHQAFGGTRCLVGIESIAEISLDTTFSRLVIDLVGLEAWWGGSATVIESDSDTTTITYTRPECASYQINDGTIDMRFDRRIQTSQPHTSKTILQETALLSFEPTAPQTIEGLIEKYRQLQDVMTILLNSANVLEWPGIYLINGQYAGRLYFERPVPTKREIKWFKAWTHFQWLRPNFGMVIDNWSSLAVKHGPAMQLFLSTKRLIPGVLENQFSNLVFSVESLHRSEIGDVKPDGKLTERIARILEAICEKKDHKWLAGKLKHAGEPNLAERLVAVLSLSPFHLDPTRLNSFAEEVAKQRNALTHFGGPRDQSYNTFIGRLTLIHEALGYLYHFVLLHRIGVNQERLTWWAMQGFESFRIQSVFFHVGLTEVNPRCIGLPR